MVGAFIVLWTVLGLIGTTAGLNWGYSWYTVLAGPAGLVATYGLYRFIGLIERIVVSIRDQ